MHTTHLLSVSLCLSLCLPLSLSPVFLLIMFSLLHVHKCKHVNMNVCINAFNTMPHSMCFLIWHVTIKTELINCIDACQTQLHLKTRVFFVCCECVQRIVVAATDSANAQRLIRSLYACCESAPWLLPTQSSCLCAPLIAFCVCVSMSNYLGAGKKTCCRSFVLSTFAMMSTFKNKLVQT